MSTLTITNSYGIHSQSFENILLYDRNPVKYSKIVYELFEEAQRLLHLPMNEMILGLQIADKRSVARSRCYLYTSRNRIECSTKGGFPQWYALTLEDYINLP
jgi:hypothetical protein